MMYTVVQTENVTQIILSVMCLSLYVRTDIAVLLIIHRAHFHLARKHVSGIQRSALQTLQ